MYEIDNSQYSARHQGEFPFRFVVMAAKMGPSIPQQVRFANFVLPQDDNVWRVMAEFENS